MRGPLLRRALWRYKGLIAKGSQECEKYQSRSASTLNDGLSAGKALLDPISLDKKWQQKWLSEPPGLPPSNGQKKTVMAMFPYPSGALHMGHVRVYTIADVLARYYRMKGFDVLYPMGWDAFGLPAENAARERGVDPAAWTDKNIAKMRTQLESMNLSTDWSREFRTCDPTYYRHTQDLFLSLYECGLAYQAEAEVNWDPIDQTVLANEQVDSEGRSWRSGALVVKKMLKQWFFKITAYQEALLKDMETLNHANGWPEYVLAMQKNWLGRSQGARVKFEVYYESNLESDDLWVYTTRPETLFGVKFLAVSANHPLVKLQLERSGPRRRKLRLVKFLSEMSELPPDSKAMEIIHHGVRVRSPLALLEGVKVTQDSHVYVAPYVLDSHGEGAVMGVPAHDQRDAAAWAALGQPSKAKPIVVAKDGSPVSPNSVYTGEGVLSKSCGRFAGMESKVAAQKIVEELAALGLAEKAEVWRLRDWLISRQRYWGTPIPIVHCETCGPVPVPREQLPVELPKLSESDLQGLKGNPLEHAHDWINTTCPKCHSPAKRETDTMDTFVDSAWYFLRFLDPQNASALVAPSAANERMPIDIYIGGPEHATLHLLYARFISKFLADAGSWPKGSDENLRGEPFKSLITQGMVHGKTYSDPKTGRFLTPADLDTSDKAGPRIKASGQTPNVSFEKMSKSKHNGVDPAECIVKYGADVTRAHMLFQAPVMDVLQWEEERIVGIQRWFGKLFNFCAALRGSDLRTWQEIEVDKMDPTRLSSEDLETHEMLRNTIQMTSSNYEQTRLNVIVSDLNKLSNRLFSNPPSNESLKTAVTQAILRMLAPIAPAFAEECWAQVYGAEIQSIFSLSFPGNLPEIASKSGQMTTVTENGKFRFTLRTDVPEHGAVGDELEAWAFEQITSSKEGNAWLADKTRHRQEKNLGDWKKVVVARGGKVINFVG